MDVGRLAAKRPRIVHWVNSGEAASSNVVDGLAPRRFEALLQLPIRSILGIDYILIVVCLRRPRASSAFAGAPLAWANRCCSDFHHQRLVSSSQEVTAEFLAKVKLPVGNS